MNFYYKLKYEFMCVNYRLCLIIIEVYYVVDRQNELIIKYIHCYAYAI